ncbi:hypothetical protein PFFVO_04847 [Plasmodium falciparum Vietnam Oak-Knoll (FVO)]|uniref:Nrap protein domain-containing protein n=1 Tax=Plasmodium falciparum Vietnam Oak-Knoll (FVO) TaxID=1036723 RepID=A0A024V1F4_PLAFA|nr:hypothetical protein PFFVO_04847 [Plasmodium falciparum Vietnam Oak-Knoll (FVO)]
MYTYSCENLCDNICANICDNICDNLFDLISDDDNISEEDQFHEKEKKKDGSSILNIEKDASGKHNNRKNKYSENMKNKSSILNLEKIEKDEDSFLDSFSFSSKNILIKFLRFILNFDWLNNPLIIEYDECDISEEYKTKLINSFITRKKNNKENKKKFWISSIYDPHCILITLPQQSFDIIMNAARITLQNIKEFHRSYEKQNWISLFFMNKKNYDIILQFNKPKDSISMLKEEIAKASNLGKQEECVDVTLYDDNNNDDNNNDDNNNDDNNNDDSSNMGDDQSVDNSVYNMEDQEYSLDYINNIKKNKNVDISNMVHTLKDYELLHVYKTHLQNFIKDLENKFTSDILILYNPLCFDEVLNINKFKNKMKNKMKNNINKNIHVLNSWAPYIFISLNPKIIKNLDITHNHKNEEYKNELMNKEYIKDIYNTSLSLNNINLLIYYIKNNVKDLLKTVKFTTI